jgi:8-oxo-dGTP pyrophosphatase MutT (NUDIX family)
MACCRAVIQPLDDLAHRFPVSVKGVLLHDGHVVLVGNSRGEWELPGGKLEPGETPEACVAREIAEELALEVTVGPLLDAWVYAITDAIRVLVVTYGCHAGALPEALVSPEGRPVGRFPPGALADLPLPAGYRRAIEIWFASAARSA